MARTSNARPSERPRPWWQRGVVYQIYPRSFQDASGEGVGDLRGLDLRRLELGLYEGVIMQLG